LPTSRRKDLISQLAAGHHTIRVTSTAPPPRERPPNCERIAWRWQSCSRYGSVPAAFCQQKKGIRGPRNGSSGTCRSIVLLRQHATWHVPPPTLLRSPSVSSRSSFATSLSSATQAAPTQSVDITRDVALKAILKKKVKGNEENVWSEMPVLRGLDHLNVVRLMSPRAIYLPPFLTPCFFRCKSNPTSGSSRGQDTTSVLSSPWAESSLTASASADTSQSEMRGGASVRSDHLLACLIPRTG
jgi:hypothetical protein